MWRECPQLEPCGVRAGTAHFLSGGVNHLMTQAKLEGARPCKVPHWPHWPKTRPDFPAVFIPRSNLSFTGERIL